MQTRYEEIMVGGKLPHLSAGEGCRLRRARLSGMPRWRPGNRSRPSVSLTAPEMRLLIQASSSPMECLIPCGVMGVMPGRRISRCGRRVLSKEADPFMPYAEHAETAQLWATNRVISCWVSFAGDLQDCDTVTLSETAAASRANGAHCALVVPFGSYPSAVERVHADIVVAAEDAPEPWGVFEAMRAVGVTDVREVEVLAAS